MEVAEVAAVLGLTAGAVMTRNTRALARLRALLDDERPRSCHERDDPRRVPILKRAADPEWTA